MVELGGMEFSFVSDEPREKIERIKKVLFDDFEKYQSHFEEDEKDGFERILVLLVLNHISREMDLKDQLKNVEEKYERVLVEGGEKKRSFGEMAG